MGHSFLLNTRFLTKICWDKNSASVKSVSFSLHFISYLPPLSYYTNIEYCTWTVYWDVRCVNVQVGYIRLLENVEWLQISQVTANSHSIKPELFTKLLVFYLGQLGKLFYQHWGPDNHKNCGWVRYLSKELETEVTTGEPFKPDQPCPCCPVKPLCLIRNSLAACCLLGPAQEAWSLCEEVTRGAPSFFRSPPKATWSTQLPTNTLASCCPAQQCQGGWQMLSLSAPHHMFIPPAPPACRLQVSKPGTPEDSHHVLACSPSGPASNTVSNQHCPHEYKWTHTPAKSSGP